MTSFTTMLVLAILYEAISPTLFIVCPWFPHPCLPFHVELSSTPLVSSPNDLLFIVASPFKKINHAASSSSLQRNFKVDQSCPTGWPSLDGMFNGLGIPSYAVVEITGENYASCAVTVLDQCKSFLTGQYLHSNSSQRIFIYSHRKVGQFLSRISILYFYSR